MLFLICACTKPDLSKYICLKSAHVGVIEIVLWLLIRFRWFFSMYMLVRKAPRGA